MITFQHVSKRFRRQTARSRAFKDVFITLWQRAAAPANEPFWVLKDVTFSARPGETLGFIGMNGAGKSTILKLAAQIIRPTSGHITVQGRVGALLELGAGFHPDLTGRENIYLNAALLGIPQAEIRRRFADIVAFAELENFVDVPVKHYSSGMYVRLGFAVAVHIMPDILLIDETLSVGDQNFQMKCISKINELRRNGVTLLIVSHDLNLIEDLSTHVCWIEKGVLKMYDRADLVIPAYVQQAREAEIQRLAAANAEVTQQGPVILPAQTEADARLDATTDTETISDESPPDTTNESPEPTPRPIRYGNGQLLITQVVMQDAAGEPHWHFTSGATVTICLHYQQIVPAPAPIFSVLIHREDGLYVNGVNTFRPGAEPPALPPLAPTGMITLTFDSLALAEGTYLLSVAAYTRPDPPYWSDPADFHNQAYHFHVESATYIHGVVALPASWQHTPLAEPPDDPL